MAAREPRATRHRHPDPRLRRRRASSPRCTRSTRRSDALDHRRGEGPARQVRLHAHGAGRLQRRARDGGFDRAPLHGHDRGRQVAARPGARVDARHRCAIERIRELENELGCFFDRNPDGTDPPEGVRRADLRPHGAQGRPDRASRSSTGSPSRSGRARSTGSKSIARVELDQETRRRCAIAGVLMHRHAHRRIRVRAARRRCCSRPAAGRPMYQLPHAFGRQDLRRPGDGAARRAAAARHGDGAVPSDRAARRARTRA